MSTDPTQPHPHSQHYLVKAVVGVFATVVAPVLVAMGIKLSEKVVVIPDPDSAAKASVSATSTSSEMKLEKTDKPIGPPSKAIVPTKPMQLFNGGDLTNFRVYLGPLQLATSKRSDRDKTFTVKDGVIRVSGKVPGVLETKDEYANYHLKLKYKWGTKTWAPRADNARMSGVLLHCFGSDGAIRHSYPLSIRCELTECASGNMVAYGGDTREVKLTAESIQQKPESDPKFKLWHCYEPGAPLSAVTFGAIKRRPCDLAWDDKRDYCFRDDLEHPNDWNELECICRGNRVVVILNDRTVNDVMTNRESGPIALQSQFAEVMFRDIDLLPVAAP
jgi:hypothetical protein